MKLLVDEMPYTKDDCIFVKQKWSEDEGTWINYCKFTDERCDLNLNKLDKLECSFLKEQDE